MKHLQIAGLCLMALLAMSVVMAATASATPHGLVCSPATSGSSATKYSANQCAKAEAGGNWEWSELDTELPVRGRGTLRFEDEIASGTTVTIICSAEGTGRIGPGNSGKIETITEIKCEKGENCGALDKRPNR